MEFRPFSSLSRGTGNLSGCLHDDVVTNSCNLYARKGMDNCTIPKTYSTRYGALFLFADTYYSWRERQKEIQQSRNLAENDISSDLKSLKNFRKIVLQFGLDDNAFMHGVNEILDDASLVNIRAGHSPNRYLSSAVKLWNPCIVEKLLKDHVINKRLIQKYFLSILPDLEINGIIMKDTLLKNIPRAYSFPILNNQEKQVVKSKQDNPRRSEPFILPRIDVNLDTDIVPMKDETTSSYTTLPLLSNSKSYYHYNGYDIDDSYKYYQRLSVNGKADLLYHILCNATKNVDTKTAAKRKSKRLNGKVSSMVMQQYYSGGLYKKALNENITQSLFPPDKNCKQSSLSTDNTSTHIERKSYHLPEIENIHNTRFSYKPTKLVAAVKLLRDENFLNQNITTKDKEISRRKNMSVYGYAYTMLPSESCSSGTPEILNLSTSVCSNVDLYQKVNVTNENRIAPLISGVIKISTKTRESPMRNDNYQTSSLPDNCIVHATFSSSSSCRSISSELSNIQEHICNNLDSSGSGIVHSSPQGSTTHSLTKEEEEGIDNIESRNNNFEELITLNDKVLQTQKFVDFDSSRPPTTISNSSRQSSMSEVDTIATNGQLNAVIRGVLSRKGTGIDLITDVNTIITEVRGKEQEHALIEGVDNSVISVIRKDHDVVPSLSENDTVIVPIIRQNDNIPFVSKNNVIPFLTENDVIPCVIKNDVIPYLTENDVIPSLIENDAVAHEEIRKKGNLINSFTEEEVNIHMEEQINNESDETCRSGMEKNITAQITDNNLIDTTNTKPTRINPKQENVDIKLNEDASLIPFPLHIESEIPPLPSTNKKKKNLKKKEFLPKQKITKVSKSDLTNDKKPQLKKPTKVNKKQNLRTVRNDKVPVKEQKMNVADEKSLVYDRMENAGLFTVVVEGSSTTSYIERRTPDILEEKQAVYIPCIDNASFFSANIESIKLEEKKAMIVDRNNAIEARRAKIEERRKEKELRNRQMMEEEKRACKLQQDLEEELRLKAEEKVMRLKKVEEQETASLHEAQRLAEQNALERERLLKRRKMEQETIQKRMSLLLAEREAEMRLKQAKEKLAREIEEELRQKEAEMLSKMKEQERKDYMLQKEMEERLQKQEEEEKLKRLESQRIRDEKERKRKVRELEQLRQRILCQQYVDASYKIGKDLLELAQQISQAYTYSYFHQLPLVLHSKQVPTTTRERFPLENMNKLPSLAELMEQINENQ